MRTYDIDEAKRIDAPAWMIDLLAINPAYVHWGPHEDYMWKKEGAGWDAPIIHETWAGNHPGLDDLNEVVNFYFSVERDEADCDACGQSGYNPATRRIADSFYSHSCPSGAEVWNDKITQDEVEALAEHHRLWDFGQKWNPETQTYSLERMPTAAEVNARQGRGFMGHDAINRSILIEARAKRLGGWGHCTECDGQGSVITSPAARLALTLWVLHPRKGASRGWEIKNIERQELPEVFTYLREAAARNAARFASIPGAPSGSSGEGES